MRELSNLYNGVVLQNSVTPVTTVGDNVTTAVTDAALSKLKAGVGVVLVQAAEDGDADETYVVHFEGRDVVGSGTYVSLGSVTVPRGATGVTGYLVNIDQVKNDMRMNAICGGTTPSLTYSAMVVAKTIYEPGGDVV